MIRVVAPCCVVLRLLIMSGIKGSCLLMCPKEEVEMREKENLVHVLEVWNTVEHKKVLVKCYSRSAADSNMAVPQLLRPFDVLKQCVHYLLLKVTKRCDVTIPTLYDFINDRLRSVRQDAIIQQLPAVQCLVLLEPMIRFYVFYSYTLSDYPKKDFDPVLNKQYLLECLKWFLNCWDQLHNRIEMDDVSEALSAVHLDDCDRLICDNILVESLYILCNLDDVHPVYRYLTLPKTIQRCGTLRTAFNIAIASLHGNFVRALRLADELCPLTRRAFSMHIPRLQRRGLLVLCAALGGGRGRGGVAACAAVARALHFADEAAAARACRHYGLPLEPDSDRIIFDKRLFKHEAPELGPEKYPHPDDNIPLKDLFTYKC